jgi:hypothetical protein
VNAKTIAGWLALALVMWLAIVGYTAAALDVHNVGTFLSDAASNISNFFASI